MRIATVLVLCSALLVACGDEPAPAPVTYDVDGRAVGVIRVPAERPNLIVVLIDTLRADALERQLGDEANMPFLRALEEKGLRFDDAAAPAPWTVPSIASLLTGRLPHRHRCDDVFQPQLSDTLTTYAEVLTRTYGYECAGFVDGPWFNESGSMLQGFGDGKQGLGLARLQQGLDRWLDTRDAAKPFFLFVHTFEAHDPYGEANHPSVPPWSVKTPQPKPESYPRPWELTRIYMLDRERRNALVDKYGRRVTQDVLRYTWSGYPAAPRPDLADDLRDAYYDGVRWVDGLLAKSIGHMESQGLLENTLLVVTSDHGEAFGEHGMLVHGRQMYDELIRIPLVASGPAPFDAGRAIAGGIGLIDVLPTFFDWAGLAPIPDVDGRSFLPLVRGTGTGRVVLSEEELNEFNTQEPNRALIASARSDAWKYIITYDLLDGAIREELYDLKADPGEQKDLAVEGRIDGAKLDDAFCAAVERLRDRIWTAAKNVEDRGHTIYGVGSARSAGPRPSPCK